MRYSKMITWISTLLFLFAIDSSTAISFTSTEVSGQNSPDQNPERIELNAGSKWQVDSNMLIHIRSMESDVADFHKSGKKDYAILSGKLLADINLLTSNCTMKGQAHDELHKWLLPYIDLVGAFSKAGTNEEAQKRFHEIQRSFETFNRYFQ